MYYIKNLLKIINNKLINLPKYYSFFDNNVDNSVFSGFNEIDLCITIKKTTKIERNYNFCEIDSKKELIKENKLVLYEGNTYIFEIKKNIGLFLDKMEHIDEVHERFIESFKYIEINRKKVYNIKNYKKIFICDHNKGEAELIISSNEDIQNKKALYMNPQVGFTSMLRMNKNIKNLN